MKFKSIDLYEDKPIYIIFEITRECNYNCLYCTYKKKNLRLSVGNIKNIIDKLSLSSEIFDIDFMGGEVTLHPDLVEIIKYSLIKLKNSTIHISTNLSNPLSYFVSFNNQLNKCDISRLVFYATYHSSTDIYKFKEKIKYLYDNGYRIYLKFLCDSEKFEYMKNCYDILNQHECEKFFVKYLWNYRENNTYSDEYLEWMKQSSYDNGDVFYIKWEDDGKIITKDYTYIELKDANLDIFKGYYCRMNRLLCINVMGAIVSVCKRNSSSILEPHKIGNAFTIKDFDCVFSHKNDLIKCPYEECTELFNNPYKCRRP